MKYIYIDQYKRAVAGNQSWFPVQDDAHSVNLQDSIQVDWKSRELYICSQEATVKINIFCYSYVKKRKKFVIILFRPELTLQCLVKQVVFFFSG